MGVMVQIPDVPDDLYRRLAVRAEKAGVPLSEYLLGELRKVSELGSMEEALERLRARPETHLSVSPAAIIRAARDAS